MAAKRNVHKVFAEKPAGKRPLERLDFQGKKEKLSLCLTS
jgi:hypothetical protein